jgi:hypothetical protein
LSRPTDRRDALLADRTLEGLSEAEASELEQLGGAGDDSLDLAAAAVALAELGPLEPLPELLAARVLAGARSEARRRPRWDLGRSAGWLAAAAALLLAVFAWTRPPQVVERMVKVEVPAPPARLPTPAERRAELLAQAADARTFTWSATPDPAARGATGDVVWSESRQQGYLRIRGLAVNDPARAQYQLWIFDARREQAHPVDGGVFDVQGGDVIVPIRAAIHVFEPKLFAVTVEKPGGVVVSKRERIVLTASI